jgi:septum formation protein
MIILASASPRRRDMLEGAGLEFAVRPADADESPLPNESPEALVERLAAVKAQAVDAGPSDTVIAADTVVTIDAHILGKPTDLKHAEKMISVLQGRSHKVMTGVCILRAEPFRIRNWVTTTTVAFNDLSMEDIRWYLENSSPLDKAGAYAIQEHGEFLVASIDGSYDNVVGLPLQEVLQELDSFLDCR